jgi:hypothetical protein
MVLDMETKRDPRRQGDLGELSAMTWFASQGAGVFVPMFHCRDFDLVVHYGDGLRRVQVKTSTFVMNNRWKVAVCTSGGNRSWSGVVKRLDPEAYDLLFVLVADGRRWLIPSRDVQGGRAIHLGGPQYAGYEIDPDPIGLREMRSVA